MSSTTSTPGSRRPYHGSCHCGFTRYVVYMTLPPQQVDESKMDKTAVLRTYKCNCTPCHKMGFFHIRLPDAPNDFILLNPLNPFKELGDYQCSGKKLHWLFCPKCGVRCFIFNGQGRIVEKTIPEGGREETSGSSAQKVWVPDPEGWIEGTGIRYLSVNATTLEARQEGLDLREWVDKKLVRYIDCLDETRDATYERPHVGGTY